ncbi:MAG: trypsin-like peptidase domain-containing protein [Sphingorhabdus sp.]|uniref:trypsin-like peptidase domain-containing protein n=2 Tax=Sphingorhabdus sp. TaxID=1902408 RepID=UPI00273EA35D|nr:trypsin-like peptidase domain-containing protein [Sphingorhabdus sp.]MDP4756833.1 trypsin-like peptidase domain-containing protein [Sphingorhabdus sp.]MDP4873389.1 trypsin-like peptidase domain-containing protein [Sphingorhabdus sp.]MDP4926216.1 trypsin-like peptidase domain-containing protein [Sphingorhabdus sp.]
MRYAYAVTTALLMVGGTVALVNDNPVTAQTGLAVSEQANLAPGGAPATFADLAAQLQPAVVNIATRQKVQVATSLNPLTGERRPVTQEQASGGSGFLISSDGYIVTNNHVIVGGPAGGAVDRVTVTLFDGKEYEAEIVGRDPSSDVALLKIRATGLPFVKMADSKKSRVGDWVIAIGNPLGLGNTVTAGIISALQRNIGAGGAYDRFIQTDTAINPGNSGGPLFNLKGEVVGINNRLISPVGANIGVGFAIPADEAIPVIESLKKGVRPERGYLGISITPVSEDLADALGLEKNRGEFVARVVAGEGADKAGLKEGDIVLRVDSREVTPEATLSYIVANIKPGTRIPLDILREGKPLKLTATIGARPPEEKLAQSNFNPEENKDFDKQTDTPDSKVIRDKLGLSVIPLDAEIARALGMAADVKGIVVDVPGAGTAAQVGLRRGDVIVSANYKPVTTAAGLATAVKDAQAAGRGAILLGVKRRGAATQYVTVRLED